MPLIYGEKMRGFRDMADLSNADIADRMSFLGDCEVTEQEVCDCLRGKSEPRAGFILAMMQALGVKKVDPRWFGFGNPRKPGAK